MLVSLVPAAAPTGHTIEPQIRGLLIKWPKPSWSFFGAMRGYRYPSNADALARTNETKIFEITETWQHLDSDALTDNTDYYYRLGLVDEFGNPGALSTVLTAKYRPVMDTDTHQAPPSVPSVVLTSYTGDIDNDDTIDTGLTITVTPGAVDADHPKAVSYICRLYKSATSGGTYVFHKRYPMPEDTLEVEVPQKWFYKAEVRAVSFSGAMSALSTQPVGATGVQPAKYLGTIPTPSAPTVTPVANGMAISWPKATYAGHKETIIFVDGVELRREAGNGRTDTTIRTAGTSYTYTLQNVDKQGRVGTVSSGTAATYRRAAATDLSVLDLTSNVENGDMSLGPNIGWATSSLIANDPTNAFRGTYVGKRAYTGAASSAVNRNKMLFPVRAGEQYYIGGMLKTDGAYAGAGFGWRLSYCSDAAGVTEIAISPLVGNGNAINTVWAEYGGLVTVPATAGIAYARLEYAVYSQTAGTVFFQSGYARPAVTKGMTDQTALAAPGSIPVLTQANQDVDGDGSTDIAISAAYTAVTGAVSHELEISTCATVGGTYVVREIVPATVSLAKVFDAKTTLYYKARSRGIAFNGTPGAWSGLSAALKPVKPANTVPTVGTPTVVAFAGYNRITAPAVAITNLKKANVYRYIGASSTPASATLIGSTTAGIPYDDAAASLVAGNVCWYYLTAVNSWGDESASKSTGASATYRVVQTADMGVDQVTTDIIAPDAIRPSNLFPRDFTNLVRDPEMLEIGNWTATGVSSFTGAVADAGNWGPGKFILKLQTVTALTVTVKGTIDIPVEAYLAYYIAGVVRTAASGSGDKVYLDIEWYDFDTSGNPVYLSTTTVANTPFVTGETPLSGSASAPVGAQIARLVYRFVFFDLLYAPAFAVNSPTVIRKTTWRDLADNAVKTTNITDDSVTTVKVASHNISDHLSAYTSGNISCGAATDVTVQSRAFTIPASSSIVMLTGRFRNTSGGTRTMTVSIKDDLGTTIEGVGSWDVRDNEYAEVNAYQFEPTAGSRTYSMVVNMSVAGTVANRKLHVVPLYR